MSVLQVKASFMSLMHNAIEQSQVIRKSPKNGDKGTGRLSLFNLIEDVENAKDQLR